MGKIKFNDYINSIIQNNDKIDKIFSFPILLYSMLRYLRGNTYCK